MKTSYALNAVLLSAFVMVGCSCGTLKNQIPQATVEYDRLSGQLRIHSAKDVKLEGVEVVFHGTNEVTLKIAKYTASNNTDLIKAALVAQQNQLDAIGQGLGSVTKAAIEGIKGP